MAVRSDARDAAGKYWLLVLMLAAWELSGRLGLVDQAFVPSLSAALSAVFDMWERTHLFMHVMVSLARVTAGLLAAAAVGVPLAYLLGRTLPGLAERIEALLRVFALINPYCVFPLFVVFFGAGELPKIAVLAWVSLWPVLFGTLAGVRGVDPALIRTARSMAAGSSAVFWKVVLPAASPSVFNGMRTGVGMSFFILIAAEMTGATAGLGWIVHSAGALNQVPRIYGAGLCIVLLGVLLNRSLLFFGNGLFFWWKSGTDPLAGVRTEGAARRLGLRSALAAAALFAVAMGVGAYEIWRAEALLNDPGEMPEYRVWAE
ncbi:MAG: ABC transporter permease [Deltaproteobacteria bacterium]|jgi:NitT/TauT family transport system permease protein|nr:ABC transporter permease [Deltaproteobacteria bacterium]